MQGPVKQRVSTFKASPGEQGLKPHGGPRNRWRMDAFRLKQTIFRIFIVNNIGHGLCTVAKIWFFYSFSSLDFIESVLQEITQAHPVPTAQCAMAHEICGLALEMFTKQWRAGSIQWKDSPAGRSTKKAIRNALNHLSERSPEKLNGRRKTYHIHRTFYFSGAGAFERQLCSNFQSLLSSLGEVLCGDEKLFRFTGKGWNRSQGA